MLYVKSGKHLRASENFEMNEKNTLKLSSFGQTFHNSYFEWDWQNNVFELLR